MNQPIEKIFLYVIIVLSAVFHEYAHAYVAYRLGDSTAKDEGRLTLNPLAHLDPIGTVFLPLLLLFVFGGFIGWAKPVPYNPYMLRDQRYGSLKVALAGPATNIILALVLSIVFRLSPFLGGIVTPPFLVALAIIIYINIFLALFNLIPLPPLDGSKVFADLFPGSWSLIARAGPWGIFLAVLVAFYFLPPLAQLLFRLMAGIPFVF